MPYEPKSSNLWAWDVSSFLYTAFNFFLSLIYLCLAVVGLRRYRGPSLVVGSGPLSSCAAHAPHRVGLSWRGARALGHSGPRSCSVQAPWLWLPAPRAQAQQLWCTGLAAPQHWDLPRSGIEPVSPALISRQILYHWATREALRSSLVSFNSIL